MSTELVINVCDHGTRNVSIDDDNGGTIIAGPRCCGRWHVERAFTLNRRALSEIVNVCENALETMDDIPAASDAGKEKP